LAFHAFLRWVLHYLFMLSLTDMCDDHRFMFSHLDELVRFSRGRGGAEFLAKRFTVSAVDLLAAEETKAASKERDDLKKQVSDLKKQRVLDAQVSLKERERLGKVAQSLKANNTKNSMLEQELDRVREVLSNAITKRMELEKELKAAKKKNVSERKSEDARRAVNEEEGEEEGSDFATPRMMGRGKGHNGHQPPPQQSFMDSVASASPLAGAVGTGFGDAANFLGVGSLF